MSADKEIKKRLTAIEARLDVLEEKIANGKTAKKKSTRTPGLTNNMRLYIATQKEKGVDGKDAKAAWAELDQAIKDEWSDKAKKYNDKIKKQAVKTGSDDDDDDDNDTEEAPKAKGGRKPGAKKPVSDDDTEEAPKAKGGRKPGTKKAAPVDDDTEEAPKAKGRNKPAPVDDDEEAPKPKGGRKPSAKKAAPVDDDDEEAPKAKGSKKIGAKKSTQVVNDSDDNGSGDNGSEENPRINKRAVGNKSSALKSVALSDEE